MWAGVIIVAALVRAGAPVPVEDQVEDQDEVRVQLHDEDQIGTDTSSAPAPATARTSLAPAPQGPALADSDPLLLRRREASDGGATERVLEPSGGIFLHSLTRAGTVEACTRVGSLLTLPIVRQEEAAGGEFVHVVRDDSGALLRYVVQADGEPRAVVLLQPPPEGLSSR